MLNYTQIKYEIEKKGTEEIKYKLYNSNISNEDLYKMYNDTQDFIQREKKYNKKRAKLCNDIVDIIYNHGLYFNNEIIKEQLINIHEDILKRETYLKAKGLDRFETLIKKEELK